MEKKNKGKNKILALHAFIQTYVFMGFKETITQDLNSRLKSIQRSVFILAGKFENLICLYTDIYSYSPSSTLIL